MNRTAIGGMRRGTAKKSLRIRKSKVRPPALTKQNTVQNSQIIEKSRKLQSSERNRRIRHEDGLVMIKKMYSEELVPSYASKKICAFTF